MTDRITPDKQAQVEEVIETLNKELHPLVVKAVLIDTDMPYFADKTRACVLEAVLIHIQELIALVIEQ